MVSRRTDKQISGDSAEDYVANFLKGKGHEILARKFSCRWGELDLVSRKDTVIYFIEVRYRKNSSFFDPAKIISKHKITSLKRSVIYYIKKNNISEPELRFLLYVLLETKSELRVEDYDISNLFPEM